MLVQHYTHAYKDKLYYDTFWVCGVIFPDDGLVASNETCRNLVWLYMYVYVHSVGPTCTQ